MGVCEGECIGRSPGDESLNLTRYHSYMKPLKGESSFVAKPKGHKGEILYFFSLLLQLISWHDACQPRGDSMINE